MEEDREGVDLRFQQKGRCSGGKGGGLDGRIIGSRNQHNGHRRLEVSDRAHCGDTIQTCEMNVRDDRIGLQLKRKLDQPFAARDDADDVKVLTEKPHQGSGRVGMILSEE